MLRLLDLIWFAAAVVAVVLAFTGGGVALNLLASGLVMTGGAVFGDKDE